MGDCFAAQLPSAMAPDDRAHAARRARFLLKQMGALGYRVMAVGDRDLVLHPGDLRRLANEARVTLLAANLVDAAGKAPFEGRKIETAGGRRIGFFAVVGGAEYAESGLKVLPPASAARAQIEALRAAQVDLVVGLVHMPYDDALRLSEGLGGADFLIQAHDGRPVVAQTLGKAILAGAGERGQTLGRAAFSLAGSGPLFDLTEAGEARQQVAEQERQVAEIRARLKANPKETGELGPLLKALERRRDELRAKASAKPPPGRRTVEVAPVPLDSSVPDDPATRAALEKEAIR